MDELTERPAYALTGAIMAAAIEVHSRLGPGLLEIVYEECLVYELQRRGMRATRQVPVPVVYDEVRLDAGFRIDIEVDGRVLVEVKAVERLLAVHEAQLLTYLKLTGLEVGLLMNFNVSRLKDGVRRLVRSRPSPDAGVLE